MYDCLANFICGYHRLYLYEMCALYNNTASESSTRLCSVPPVLNLADYQYIINPQPLKITAKPNNNTATSNVLLIIQEPVFLDALRSCINL